MITVPGKPEIHVIGWQFCHEMVAINVDIMVLLSIVINNLIPR